MFRPAIRRCLSVLRVGNSPKRLMIRTAVTKTSGPRAAAEESSLVQSGADAIPSSLRDIQANLPAIQQRSTPKKDIRIKQTGLKDDNIMEIAWYDGTSSNYPYAWLRDNCQCESCFDQYAKKRKTMAGIDLPRPDDAKNLLEGTLLHVKWNEGHDSYYTANWLQEHCFEMGMRPYWRKNYSPEPWIWNEKLCEAMKKINYDYEEIMTNDSKLLEWLAVLQKLGYAKISGAPTGGDEVLNAIISRCSPTAAAKSHDRGAFCTFQSYDAGFQTGLPYYSHVPGIQLLHCDVPADGPAHFVDGFAAAAHIRNENGANEESSAFQTLSSLEVAFHDEAPGETEAAMKFLRRRVAPTFELDKNREVWRINYNNECRDSAMATRAENEVLNLYDGLYMMESYLNSSLDNAWGFEYHMSPGDVVCVNNWRVAVKHKNGGTFTQAFFDWDEAQSKVNVLSGQHRDLRFNPEMKNEM